MPEGNIESIAKGRAIHRPTGWIRSYRSKVVGLAEGKVSLEEYVCFDVLLHVVGWDPKKPGYGQIERNISRLQAEWFTFWSRSTLIKYLRALAAKELILDDGHTIIVVNFAKYQGKNGVDQPTPPTDPGVDQPTVSVDGSTVGVGGSTVSVDQPTVSVDGSTLDTPQTQSPSVSDEPKETLKKDKKLNKKDKNAIEDRFSIFWSVYPRKVKKPEALKSFQKIDPDEELFATILDALERYKKTDQWTKDNGDFIPHPTTWLNQKRWEDEIKPPSKEVNPNGTNRTSGPSTENVGPLAQRIRERDGELFKVRGDTNGPASSYQAG